MDPHRGEQEDDKSDLYTESAEYQRRTQPTLRLRSGEGEIAAQFANQGPLDSSRSTSDSLTGPDQYTDSDADPDADAQVNMSTSHSFDMYDTEPNQNQSYRGGGRGQRGGHQGPYRQHGRSGFQHEYYDETPYQDFDDRQWDSSDREHGEELFDAEEYDDEWMGSALENPNTYTPHHQRQPYGDKNVHEHRNATYRREKGESGYRGRRGGRDDPRAGYPNRGRFNEHITRNSPSPSRSENRERDNIDGQPWEPSRTKLDSSSVTLKVYGFSPSVDEDLLQMYFESPKRSGGGEMEGFQMSSSRRSATMVFNEATGKFRL